MNTEGKTIITAPDGKRFVLVGAKALFREYYGKQHLFIVGTGVSCKLTIREIKRDAKGRKFKEGGK